MARDLSPARSRAIGRGLRVAIVLPLVMWAFTAADAKSSMFLAAFAVVIFLVTADFAGPRPERAASIVLTAIGGLITLIIGGLLQPHPLALIAAALVLGVLVTLVSALRGFLTKATVPILLPFFVAATSPNSAEGLAEMALGWIIGSAIATVAAVAMWPYFPRAKLTESLANAMRAHASAIRSFWKLSDEPAKEALERSDEAAAGVLQLYSGQLARPGAAYRRERFLVRLVEETRRLWIELRLGYRRLPFVSSEPDRVLVGVTAQALDDSAATLLPGSVDLQPFENVERARAEHRTAIEQQVGELLSQNNADEVIEVATSSFRPRAVSLLGLSVVRDAGGLGGSERLPRISLRGGTLPAVLQPVNPWQRLTAELSLRTPWMRNALRLGLTLAVALAVVEYTGVQKGYWVVLGTLSVLRMDLVGTGRTAWKVIAGQLLGFLGGLLVIQVVSGHPALPWILLPLLAGLQGYVANNAPMIVQQAGFTMLLVNMVMLSAPRSDIAALRLEDVALGVAVAVVISLIVFPRGLVPRVEQSLRRAVDDAGAYLVATMDYAERLWRGEDVAEPSDAETVRSLGTAVETIDLAIAQTSQLSAMTTLWMRVLGAAEYLVYVGDIVAASGRSHTLDPFAARAGGDLLTATKNCTERLSLTTRRLLDASEDLADAEGLPEFSIQTTFTEDLLQGYRSICSAVEQWSSHADAEAAPQVLSLFWTLGWISEIDLLDSGLRGLTQAIGEESTEAVPQPVA